MTWVLVILVFGGMYASTPAVSTISGFRTEAGCKAEANKLNVSNGSRVVMTFCLDQSR